MVCPTAPMQSHHEQGHHGGQILSIQPGDLPLLGLGTGDHKVPRGIPLADPKFPWGQPSPSEQTLCPWLPQLWQGPMASGDSPARVRDSPTHSD